MSYIKHTTKKSALNLYPLSCLHVGAQQSDRIFIEEHIERIRKDSLAKWVYMGDGGECVTKLSKGCVFKQEYSPQIQLEILLKLLKPIRDKGLLAIRGNHGGRIFKETGISFDKNLAMLLGVPYMGVQTFMNLVVNRTRYDLFFHHGADSGVSLQTKVNKADAFSKFILADALFTAHSHIAVELPPAALSYLDNHAMVVKTKLRHQYICGSGYDSRTGYATDKGYSPLLPQLIRVEFLGERKGRGDHNREQRYTRWHSSGEHKVNGLYVIDESGEED